MSKQTADPELKAIRQIKDALERLPPSKRKRVLEYARERVLDDLNAPPEQGQLPLV